MSTIGKRLREERERLRISQEDFAERGGVQRRAQVRYESDERCPDGLYLSAIASVGADVQYVLTGIRAQAYAGPAATPLPVNEKLGKHGDPRERELLENYRDCDEEDKRAIEQIVHRLTHPHHTDVGKSRKKA